MRRILTHRQDDEGAISIMAAVLVVALIVATSLAVDVGRIAFTSRDQQGFTDRVAMDGLSVIEEGAENGDTPEQIYAEVVASALDTESANLDGSAIGTSKDRHIQLLELGYVDTASQTFRVVYRGDIDGNGAPGEYPAGPIEALKVHTESYVDFLFALFDDEGGREVVKEAIATTRYETCVPPDPICMDPFANALISVRSRILGFSTHETLYQQLVEDLLGVSPGSLSATFAGWDGLATSYVDLGVFGDAGASLASPSQFLDSQVQLKDVISAMASGLRNDDAAVEAAAAAALNGAATAMAADLDPALTIKLGHVLTATTEDVDSLVNAEMDAQTLLMALAMQAALLNGNNGVSLGMTGTDVLGLTGLGGFSLNMTLIEAPQFAFGRAAWDADNSEWITRAETAQVELDLTVDVNGYYADDLLGPIEDLVPGLLCAIGPLACPRQNVTIEVDVAQAETSLTRIDCQDPESDTDTDLVDSSEAVVASVGSNDAEIISTRNDQTNYGVDGRLVQLDTVPGVSGGADFSVGGAGSLQIMDGLLEPVLGFAGADVASMESQVHDVECGVRQLVTLLPAAP